MVTTENSENNRHHFQLFKMKLSWYFRDIIQEGFQFQKLHADSQGQFKLIIPGEYFLFIVVLSL